MADFKVNKQLEMYADSIFSHFGKDLLRYEYDEYEEFISELDYSIMDGDVMEIPELDREDAFKLALNMAEFEYSDSDYNDSMDGDFDSNMSSAGFGTDEDYGYYGESVFKDADEVIKMLKESIASSKAKKAGLVHIGFGNYAKEPGAPAQYKTVDGKLKKVGDGTKKQKSITAPKQTATKKEEPKKEKPKSGIQNLRRVSGEKYTYEYEESGRKYKFTLTKQERKELKDKASIMSIVQARQKKKSEKEKSKLFKKGKKSSSDGNK